MPGLVSVYLSNSSAECHTNPQLPAGPVCLVTFAARSMPRRDQHRLVQRCLCSNRALRRSKASDQVFKVGVRSEWGSCPADPSSLNEPDASSPPTESVAWANGLASRIIVPPLCNLGSRVLFNLDPSADLPQAKDSSTRRGSKGGFIPGVFSSVLLELPMCVAQVTFFSLES